MHDYMDQVVNLMEFDQNRPLNQIVYEGLKKAIVMGVIPVGERINEKVYADRLNISRTPMRNAIKKLEDEEILKYIQNYGVVVKKVTLDDVEEIYKIRYALDVLAAKTAIELITGAELNEMKMLLDKATEMHNAGEVEKAIALSSEFNSMLYHFAKMPRLKTVVKQLKDYLARFRDISLMDDKRRLEAFNEHYIIYECLKNKDVEKIKDIMELHLGRSKEFVKQEIIRWESGF